MKIINASMCYIDQNLARAAIDSAIDAGHSISRLRWRVSKVQRHAIRKFIFMVADNHTLRQLAEFGPSEVGMLAGVPFYVDPHAADDVIVLERAEMAEDVARIEKCLIPAECAK